MATAAKRLLTVEEFLRIEFDLGDSATRVELDNGAIRMMGGGSGAHSRVQGNIFAALFERLKHTDCRPHGPDMGVRTHALSLRYPDVSVYCGREGPTNDRLLQFDDPKMVVEVLSPSTRHKDEDAKLWEYQALASLEAILHVDPEVEKIRLLTRTMERGWQDVELETGADVNIEALGVTLAWSEIFAR